ncbi:PREDICTED: protein phosphatase 1 regulatory subunit 14C isoform X1 [Chinchilla lanigera]|uniref:protein phosphatase 1 regulatory subunit 14C isoform X1 n=1 Tax=Chinchilla lanigera TaxID=34839 RepID=UPI0006975FBF|nr:PREDICTED: protein phosphatase 1 regulatory subunit 14C isoform X1 [Chinchilla lanigera]
MLLTQETRRDTLEPHPSHSNALSSWSFASRLLQYYPYLIFAIFTSCFFISDGFLWEEEMPDVEIDIDDLLDADSEEERASKLQEALVDCYKPTEEFIKELLSRIRGMRKLSPPQKKSV